MYKEADGTHLRSPKIYTELLRLLKVMGTSYIQQYIHILFLNKQKVQILNYTFNNDIYIKDFIILLSALTMMTFSQNLPTNEAARAKVLIGKTFKQVE